jgi:hypothetical protein
MSDIVITNENFSQHFHDVRTNSPKRGQVMARYAATAELVDGDLKRDIIDMLCLHEQIESVMKILRKLAGATEKDAIKIPLEMSRDLLTMTPDEVAAKPYPYVCEFFFYTKKELIPVDPHWTCISIDNLEQFLDAADNKCKMTARVLSDEEKPKVEPTYGHDEAGSSGTACTDDREAEAGSIFDIDPSTP